jgi:hypothetical protein
MTSVEEFGAHINALDRLLAEMTPDQGLEAVFRNDEALLKFYFRIASLNRFFHLCAAEGRLPVDVSPHA